jgi:hypothetical protein
LPTFGRPRIATNPDFKVLLQNPIIKDHASAASRRHFFALAMRGC